MTMETKYQNSFCDIGNYWLHDFKPVQDTQYGTYERCTRCGKGEHVPFNMPSHIYLSSRIRSVLRENDTLFTREYPHINHA